MTDERHWTDKSLGMDRRIARRDFLNGVAIAIGSIGSGLNGAGPLFQRAVAAQQRRGSLRTHATCARELVRWITAQSDEIGHLAWLDPVAFQHLGRANTGHLACPDRMKNGCGGGGELEGIAIAAGYEHNSAPTFLLGDGCGEKVVRLVT